MTENSEKDISWEAAVKKCAVLESMPKLVNDIDVIEIGSGASATIHLKDENYEASLEKYVELLKNYGYSYINYKKDKDKYTLKFYMETEDEPIAITIKGYEKKYEQTHNVYIYINKSKYNNPF